MKSRAVLVAVAGAVIAAAAPARADRKIVIESYVGDRPDNAGRLLAPVFEVMREREFELGYDGIGRGYEARVSRASRAPEGLPGNYRTSIDAGHGAWSEGNFQDAINLLTPVIQAAHANVAAIAQDTGLRTKTRGALLDLALAHHRDGNPDAKTAMAELIRSYPDVPVTRRDGPEALALYTETRTQLRANGLGSIKVEVADGGTQVFVNEQFHRRGDVTIPDLAPGLYRVYGTLGQREGRAYQVEVTANTTATVRIDVELDAAIHLDSDWVGLAYASAEDRDRLEGEHAVALARQFGASGVVVIGVRTRNDDDYLVGALVSMETTREISSGALDLKPTPGTERLAALGRYLAGDARARSSLDSLPPIRVGPRTKSRWGVIKYLTGVVGLGAAATGGTLLYLDGRCKSGSDVVNCPDLYNTDVPGWALLGGGAVVLGLAVYMFVTDTVVVPEQAVTVVPTDGGAMATALWRF
jgi:hypothetical protein